jgi:hypothetical protein
VPADDESSSLAEELAKLEKACQTATQDLSSSRNVRETLAIADVDVPRHLRTIAKVKVPALQRLLRRRDSRVEEVVKEQLNWLSREPNEYSASREFDRMKATDWSMLKAEYPDLYWKTLREANLIFDRKRKR